MLLMVSGASATVRRMGLHPHLGRLLTPRARCSVVGMAGSGLAWAADNSCYTGFDAGAYCGMLDRIAAADRTRLLWVSVPDVVGDWGSTRAMFGKWRPELVRRGIPVAMVAQDGATCAAVPWDLIDALFVGGSTVWKLSQRAARLVAGAKQRGKWVHVGRVNSAEREERFEPMGVDSIDGSQYSMFPDTYIPPALQRLARYAAARAARVANGS